jgi:hypothetical protein
MTLEPATATVADQRTPASSGERLRRDASRGYAGRSQRNEWSSEDLRLLRELASTGVPLTTIAVALHRTASAVRNKAGMQGISLRPRR